MPTSQPVVDASPTKEFFIDMLTRDIELVPAIIDLVDNSIDGARRLRKHGPYKDLFVRLRATPEEFSIVDNCGGIDLETALKYAFRFGRPDGMQRTPHSIGQFGVGMKRALFKLGRKFTVESTAAKSRFALNVDVPAWSKLKSWDLPMKSATTTKTVPVSKRGTKIVVAPLHANVGEDFGLATFQSRLRDELERAHQSSVAQGLAISLNGTPLHINVGTLLQSAELRPALREFSLNGGEDAVDAKIYCGVAESQPRNAGWYVFCNGRLVLEADRTRATGWGEREGKEIPLYHNQFARFRGYAFLESDDAGRLPWNTTKTGVDADSEVFRSVRREMLLMARPVIDFLNELDAENDREEEQGPGPLTLAVAAAKAVPLAKTKPSETFIVPQKKPKPKRTTGRIQYDRPVTKIAAVKKALGVSTYVQVGERTFDYFYDAECAEE
jgi:hypothetical protein